MTTMKLLIFSALCFLSAAIIVISGKTDEPQLPMTKVEPTIQLQPLTLEQMEDRIEEIEQQIAQENASIYDEPTTTLPQLAQIDPDTKCQEWLPLAVEMGWPNRTEVLQTLGRVMFKESRCQSISASSEWFNGHDYGLTQINEIHEEWLSEMGWTLDDMAIPSSNLRFAFLLWDAREQAGECGWQPWGISC